NKVRVPFGFEEDVTFTKKIRFFNEDSTELTVERSPDGTGIILNSAGTITLGRATEDQSFVDLPLNRQIRFADGSTLKSENGQVKITSESGILLPSTSSIAFKGPSGPSGPTALIRTSADANEL